MATPTAAPSRSRSSLWIVGAIVLVVVAIGAIAIATSGGDSTTKVATGGTTAPGGNGTGNGASPTNAASGPVVTAPVSVKGTPLVAFAGATNDGAVGQAFPEVSGVNVLDGSPLTIGNDGQAKLVFYVAHWCPHCQKEVPLIQKWLDEKGNPAGVKLYAVSTSVKEGAGNYPPATWLKREKWTVPTLADSSESEALRAAGITGFPSFVAVGKDGKVVARASGELPITDLEAMVAKLAG